MSSNIDWKTAGLFYKLLKHITFILASLSALQFRSLIHGHFEADAELHTAYSR